MKKEPNHECYCSCPMCNLARNTRNLLYVVFCVLMPTFTVCCFIYGFLTILYFVGSPPILILPMFAVYLLASILWCDTFTHTEISIITEWIK